MDRYSPVASAHIRVLVLPVGEIERAQYLAFLSRLKDEASHIRLADVERYVGDNDPLLSPKAFPQGALLYNYTTSNLSEQQQQLSPFELFREPLLVLGIKNDLSKEDGVDEEELGAAVVYLREKHPRVVRRQLLVLDDGEVALARAADDFIPVRNARKPNDPSLKEAICLLSARFLTDLGTYTRAMQASPSIQTPGQTARSLQRTVSHKDSEKRPTSGQHTPPPSGGVSSPIEEKPLPASRSSPATSFEQIQNASDVASRSGRPDSRSSNKSKPSNRSSSQDRVSVQGFGSGTSQNNLKNRGKARVGMVIGSIYLLAGQWREALRMLTEHTNKARVLQDHIWHAKGLEGIVVCMILHAWADLEFQIPSICYPISERMASAQRFSVNLPTDFIPTDGAQKASVSRLATSLPDLLKLVLSLYRSGEGSLELPFVSISEATLRFSKLLAILHVSHGEFTNDTLGSCVGIGAADPHSHPSASSSTSRNLSKSSIADVLSHAHPSSDENISMSDYVSILAGTASIYGLLEMNRKKAITIRELLVKATTAFSQARKRGAAEMGIHPAPALSFDNAADSVLATADGGNGLAQMIAEVAAIYGIPLSDESPSDEVQYISNFLGGDTMKLDVMRTLGAFSETLPDSQSILRLSGSSLRFFGPNAAVDPTSQMTQTSLSKEEQVRLTTTISHTVRMSKNLGLANVELTYWDAFLVRGVEFVQPVPDQAVVDRSRLKSGDVALVQKTGNPLLYDPNASRSGNNDEVRRKYVLVQNEVAECLVTLQNPYDVSIDVEALYLITEGLESLNVSFQKVRLEPMRLQQVPLSVTPTAIGEFKITGCRVKMAGCAEQVFPLISKPWSTEPPSLIKDIGQDGRTAPDVTNESERPAQTTVVATVIDEQPRLQLSSTSLLESHLMLLEGEKQAFSLTLQNMSGITASIFDIVSTDDAFRLKLAPGIPHTPTFSDAVALHHDETRSFDFDLVGRAGTSKAQIAFYYSCDSSTTKHARVLTVPIEMTVNAALQVQHLHALLLDQDDDAFVLEFDIGNAWPKLLEYHCVVHEADESTNGFGRQQEDSGVLAPGELKRVHMRMARLDAPVVSVANDVEAVRAVLLNRLRVSWSGQGRTGIVDLSGLSINTETLDIILRPALQLRSLQVNGSPDLKPTIKAKSFAIVRAKLLNRTAPSDKPLVLQVQSRSRGLDASLEDDRWAAIAGASHRVVPPIQQGSEVEVDVAICPLLAGRLELECFARVALVEDGPKGRWTTQRSVVVHVE